MAGRVVRQEKSGFITIYNCGNQTVPLHVKPPEGDFFLHEQAIQLRPGKTVRLPQSHVNQSQIGNLQKTRKIRVVRQGGE